MDSGTDGGTVRALLNSLSPRVCKAQQALALRQLHDLRPEGAFSSAGELRAAGMHKACGLNVADNLSPTFVSWVSKETGLHSKHIQRCWRWARLINQSVLEHIAQSVPEHGQGLLLAQLAQLVEREKADEAEQMAFVLAWLRRADEPQPVGATATEELFERDGISLRCTDSLRWMDEQVGTLFDCILVDPPYGIDYSDIIGDDDAEKAAAGFVPRMAALLRPGRALCIWASEKTAFTWVKALCRAGLSVHEVIDWDKVEPWFDGRAKEVLIVAARGALQTFGDDRAHVWSCKTVRDPALRQMHSTPKPIETQVRALRKYTRPGDVVLDCAAARNKDPVSGVIGFQ